MDDKEDISSLVSDLSDLEIALLLSIAIHEHCLIETTDACIHDVAKELALICLNIFGRTFKILECSSATSFEDFYSEVLVSDVFKANAPYSRPRKGAESLSTPHNTTESRDRTRSPGFRSVFGNKKAVDVVIAKNFNYVDEGVQLHALEVGLPDHYDDTLLNHRQLMRSKRLNTHHGPIEAPPDFLFIPLVVRNSDQLKPRLNHHLNDHLILSHFHDPTDGYVHLEENTDWLSDGQLSASSVVRKLDAPLKKQNLAVDQKLSTSVSVGADIIRYQQDIVVFLRLSRAVAGGITARSNMQFTKLSKLLATLHGIDYLTPSIVALAARKAFRHRIVLAKPEDDRSLQYGSDIQAVTKVLAHATPDSVLDGVLALEAPL
ncbi:uncharacterized protein CDV56_101686 [Aspergillus thermomutatus]|uniref:magnesium chelatase n=1 Tax=Aspergillus thermomutatus TaxID=41047 RepID=A0A397HWT5_ASPTH|nr:uncharacterized protein CDV56_101686 [Aspergillus thermomutatus]RHZ66468.1 hypothetical protein CDV56_101686 [Aspergillus thermomutatus]